jgi:hypothetical protein
MGAPTNRLWPLNRSGCRRARPAVPGKSSAKLDKIRNLLPIVNLQAVKGSQEIIGLNECSGCGAHGSPIRMDPAHTLAPSERRHNGASHLALQTYKVHTAAAGDSVARNLFAFKASSWTS